ncbi:PREDICTED: nose resistant to fluoxetine protein 6-like [Drosophila arizonae]|uniref:Nose resistant to fluoxetine protein 6-like n=1 Tax=Drosophila arizonae TaxID=7263 RepID=A0ABM1NKW0_DROAR|nr:PREDICTED: nose resistant to fluoxetine protein 6-like [Drosophila arizonae]
MVEIMAMLLLAGLALASSLQLEFDEIDSLEGYQFMELRPLAMEFSQHFRNITEKDLDLPSISQQDSQCLADMTQLLSAFRSKNIWALKMFDAWGTFPKGVLYGNQIDLGNYDECIGTNKAISDNHAIKGKYCFAGVPFIRGIILRTAVCFPASCKATHMNKFLQPLLEKLLNIKTTKALISEDSCRTKERIEYDGLTIFTIVLLSLLFAAVVLTTAYDYFFCEDQNQLPALIKIFSARANSRVLFRLVQPRSNPNVIDCLNGMRCMSLIWVLFGHQYLFALMAPNINQYQLKWWFGKPFTSFVLHAGFSVDTFLFLSGLLLVVISMRSLEKSKGKLNIPMMYLHRYLRLTPVVALAILVYMTLLPFMGDGPLFDSIKFDDYKHCKSTWFWTLLFLQNYATPDLCINHSWYLGVDMQLYILSPIFLLSLFKWGKKAAAGILVLILLLSACLFSTMMIKQYPVHMEIGVTSDEAQRKLYYATHVHAAPWLIGVLFGYFLHVNRSRNFHLNRIEVWLGWIVSLGLIFTCIFVLYPFADWLNPPLSMLEEAFYYTLARIAWPLSLCWVVFACMRGYGGLANSFLSCPLWQPLSRISYSAYIFHIFIQQTNGRRMRTGTFFSNYDVMLLFWSGFGFVLLLSYVVYITMEAPFGVLESMLIAKRRTRSQTEPSTTTTIKAEFNPQLNSNRPQNT